MKLKNNSIENEQLANNRGWKEKNEKYLTKYLNLINFFYEKIYIEDLGDIHAHFSLDAIDGDRCLHI